MSKRLGEFKLQNPLVWSAAILCAPKQWESGDRCEGACHRFRFLLSILMLWSVSAASAATSALAADDQGRAEFFEKRIRPVLVRSCYECHSAQTDELQGGLRLDSKHGLLNGGESGPAIVPGLPEESTLIRALRYQSLQMPPDGKLPEEIVADFERWIREGAYDPRQQPDAESTSDPWPRTLESRREWWSLRPVSDPRVPNPLRRHNGHPIDAFTAGRLKANGLTPSPPATATTLIRRLTLVLTGLPPTAEQVDRFLLEWARNDEAAYRRLVDRLLASPRFGERWARHWMDVVRFTETHGNEWNYEVHHAWRYRDYLIRAFNADLPYDRFVREHVAGDLLPEPRIDRDSQTNESMIGTAFYRFGEVNHDDCVSLTAIGYDILDSQIDTLSKAFQATTVACARCHHHKVDAVSSFDYYALLGILKSSRLTAHTVDTVDVNRIAKQRLRTVKSQLRTALGKLWLDDARDIENYLMAADARLRSTDARSARELDPEVVKRWKDELARSAGPEQFLWPWQQAEEGQPFAATWVRVVQKYDQESTARAAEEANEYAEYAGMLEREGSWWTSGQGLAEGPAVAGEFTVAKAGQDRVVQSILPAGWYTHLLSQKLNGTIRSAVLNTNRRFASFLVLGEKTSALRLVSNNCQLNYANYRALSSPQPEWITFELPEDAKSLQTFAELVTKFDNPKFPDQLGTLGGDTRNERVPWQEAAADPTSYFGLLRAVLHNRERPPETPLAPLTRLWKSASQSAITSRSELASRYGAVIRQSIRAWRDNRADPDEVRWLSWLLERRLLRNSADMSEEIRTLLAKYHATERSLVLPRVAPGMADFGDGADHPLLRRGNSASLGEPVPRRYLEVLASDPATFRNGSGRLQLANQIASRANPLTARVMVNRVWHYLFGTGIVRTVDDFGRVGELPSHPEMLDYLAARFDAPVGESGGLGNSVKRLIREIVLSQTFRRSGRAAAANRRVDPSNRLLHSYPARRLEAEAIRDCMLAVSQRLNLQMGGMSIHPFREESNPTRRLFAGPLDGNGRRSVYLKVNLMEGHKFLGAFNLPGGKVTQGRRDVTNVPAQALALLNDPLVLQQARMWGSGVVASSAEEGPADRIHEMFRDALGRSATSEELERFIVFTKEAAAEYGHEVVSSEDVWADVAHLIFNMQEFIYIP